MTHWCSRLALLLLCLIFVCQSAVLEKRAIEGVEEERLKVTAGLINLEKHGVVNKKAGDKFMIQCEFIAPFEDTPARMGWYNSDGMEIQTESEDAGILIYKTPSSVDLFFQKTSTKASGTYTCKATLLDDSTKEQSVEVVILAPTEWNDKALTVGAMRGERLQIDCGATGDPAPAVTIQHSLSADRVEEADNKITIKELKESDQGSQVSCFAAQTGKFPKVDSKVVSVDVYFPPSFEATSKKRHGITGKNASLPCIVSRSNPPVQTFKFYKDDQPVTGSGYEVETDIKNNRSTLHIRQIKKTDWGKYKCMASNGKATAEVLIEINKATPPGSVIVALESAGSDTIKWKITDNEPADALPIIKYGVKYIRTEELDIHEDVVEKERLWKSAAFTIYIKKENGKVVYSINGMRQRTKYSFRFFGVNEAGAGDFNQVSAITTPTQSAQKITGGQGGSGSSSVFSSSASIPSLLLLLSHCFIFALIFRR